MNTPTAEEWTTEKMMTLHHGEWHGILYIVANGRRLGSMNEHEARAVVLAHNASMKTAKQTFAKQFADERVALGANIKTNVQLRDQLAAERELTPPKATKSSQEWTKYKDSLLSLQLPDGERIECSSTEARDKVIAVHNASIAAERQATQHFTLMWDTACKQLAAEREKLDLLKEIRANELEELQRQLAAAREALENARKMIDPFQWDVTALDAALEAFRGWEMTKGTIKCYDPLCEKHKQVDWKQQALDNEKVIQDLAGQLAAANKQIEMDTECIDRIRNFGMKLEVQLDAAIEALTSIGRNTCCDKCQEAALVANAALAKLGEGK